MDICWTGFVSPGLAVYWKVRWTVPQKCLFPSTDCRRSREWPADVQTSLQQMSTFGQSNPDCYTSALGTECLPSICVLVLGLQLYCKLWCTLCRFNIAHLLRMTCWVSVDTDFQVLLDSIAGL